MKIVDDDRVWLDRQQMHTVFGAFEEQKFYSVEYDTQYTPAVSLFAKQVRDFQDWCRVVHAEINQGVATEDLTPPPAFLLPKPKTTRKPSGKAKSEQREEQAPPSSEG